MDLEPAESDPKAINRARFELELEFVQALANPYYLHSLAQQNILDQPAFISFLEYLLYFREKDYARFIQFVFGVFVYWACLIFFSYPHALHHLELLQRPQFRADMRQDEYRDMLNQKQFDHWVHKFIFLLYLLLLTPLELTNRNGTAPNPSLGDRGEESAPS